MNQLRKYAFETEFTPDGAIVSDAVKKKITPEEVEAQAALSYQKGKQDALAQAERETAAALQALADASSAILTRLDAESSAMRGEAARVAIVAARKIAGAALDAFGAERAAAAIEAAMDALRHQPRLVVKLPPAMVETLQPRITAMCETHAYAGAILVRADSSLRAGEVSIDWSDGLVTLSPADAEARINTLLDAALAAANTPS
jgi:flagellar assembly protein FliH